MNSITQSNQKSFVIRFKMTIQATKITTNLTKKKVYPKMIQFQHAFFLSKTILAIPYKSNQPALQPTQPA